jgi:hypothetical protein
MIRSTVQAIEIKNRVTECHPFHSDSDPQALTEAHDSLSGRGGWLMTVTPFSRSQQSAAQVVNE